MRKKIHNLLKGVSLTAALFVFQACYGTPMPPPQIEEEEEIVAVEESADVPVQETPAEEAV